MDEEFRKLKAAALPSTLDALDERVLADLAARTSEASATRRMMMVAALFSLGGGMVAGSVFVPRAVAASPLTPLIPESPLAPSTLLDAR
jgi:hypothetical protein